MEPALHPEAYYILPDLAIACDGPVESVLLVSRRPPEELEDRLVALSRHSLTSVYLVKLLLEKAYHVRPRYAEDDGAADVDARLVIGDEALRLGDRFPDSVDLGKAWYALTGLPFVFAVWAVRAEVWETAPAEVRAVHRALQTAKARTRAHPETMLALAQTRVGLPADACRRYLRERLCFDLGARHLEGLRTFLTMLTEAGELPAVPSLRFISV
jgi:chorismate dehydratase